MWKSAKALRQGKTTTLCPTTGLRKNSPIPATLTIPPFKLFLSNKDTKTVAVLMLRQFFVLPTKFYRFFRFPLRCF